MAFFHFGNSVHGSEVGAANEKSVSIGVEITDRLGVSWDEMYGRLVKYKQHKGDLLVPALYKEGDHRLGQWVTAQRVKKGTLTPERRQKLEDIGFVWDALTQQWEEGFAALKRFHNREGHCLVKQGHKEDGHDGDLATWVSAQRRKKETLTPERRQRLDQIGFVWMVRGKWT